MSVEGAHAHRIGVISDTHGLLRPEAVQALQGSELIIHAGDLGKAQVLDALQAIAPVVAVRGNVDRGVWAQQLPHSAVIEVGGAGLYVLHILEQLDLDPVAGGFQAVIFGHSHQPSLTERAGVLYLNPGSAGPLRFHLPVSLAKLHVQSGQVTAEILTLEIPFAFT